MTRSFFGRFPASWPGSAAGPLSPGPIYCEAFELVWSSWAQFWIIPFTFPLLQLKNLEILPSRFRSKWPSIRKLSKSFGKALSLFVLVCWVHMKLLSLFWIIFVCFVSYFHCSVETLREMSFIYCVDRGLQGKPELAFWSSFLLLGPYLVPISLWQKLRLVAVILEFHRKVTRSFLANFHGFCRFWQGPSPSFGALPVFMYKFPELISMTRDQFHKILLNILFISLKNTWSKWPILS